MNAAMHSHAGNKLPHHNGNALPLNPHSGPRYSGSSSGGMKTSGGLHHRMAHSDSTPVIIVPQAPAPPAISVVTFR